MSIIDRAIAAGSAGGDSYLLLLDLFSLRVCLLTAEAACGGDREIMVLLGAISWPRLAASYIEACLSPAVPEDDSQLEGFQATCKNAQHFEAQAASMGYAPVTYLRLCTCLDVPDRK